MRLSFIIVGVVQALVAVAALMLIDSIVAELITDWTLPFSPFWGAIVGLPAVAMGIGFKQ